MKNNHKSANTDRLPWRKIPKYAEKSGEKEGEKEKIEKKQRRKKNKNKKIKNPTPLIPAAYPIIHAAYPGILPGYPANPRSLPGKADPLLPPDAVPLHSKPQFPRYRGSKPINTGSYP
jgi:hypothetical protein